MTMALRLAPPKAADGASAGVITPRKFSRRKILGATVDGQFGAYILSRRSVNFLGRAAMWTRFAPTPQGGDMTAQGTYTPAQARYRHYLRSPRWRLLRWLRRHIDGGRCTHPGCTATTHLETHHTRYDNRGRGFWAELGDLRTLCAEHHDAAHGRGE